MKKPSRRVTQDEPSKASLREMPEADFSKPGWRRQNPYAAQIRKDGGYTVAIDGQEPYFVRVGPGRPRHGQRVEPSRAKTIRLPVSVWRGYEARAKERGTTVNAELGSALARALRKA